MSIIEDLQTAVSTVAERAGPSIVGIGRGTRGSGIVIADGKVLTNAHNLRGDEVTVTFADGRRTRGTVAGVDGDGDLAVDRRRHHRRDRRSSGATATDLGRRDRRLRRRRQPGGGTRVTFGLVSADARAFRGPGGAGSAAASSTPLPSRPGSSGGALLDATASSSASTRTGSARGSSWPCPRTQPCVSASMRSGAASRPRGPGSAWRSRRPMSPGGCAASVGLPGA